MNPITASLIAMLSAKTSKEINSQAVMQSITAFKEKLRKKFEENETVTLELNQIEASDSDNLSTQSVEIIAEALTKEIDNDPEFAKEVQNNQENLIRELKDKNPEIAQKYLKNIEKLTIKIKRLQEDVDIIKHNFSVNVDQGDYLGKDRVILSGNDKAIHISSNGVITNFLSETYTDRILAQTEQITGKITQFFTVKESMERLDKIRQPRPILTGYMEQEMKARFSFLLFGDFSYRTLLKTQKEKTNKDINEQSIVAESYFRKIKDIEAKIGFDVEQNKILLQTLRSIADEINLSISRLNNSFILALYPASSSKELIENMVSKIGYRELREESEMHLSVVSKLVEKLNNLMQKLDIDGLEEKQKNESESLKQQNDILLIKAAVERLRNRRNDEIKSTLKLIQDMMMESEDETLSIDEKNNENIYVLSDEAQAAIGMMIDIEQRRCLVEDLVRLDRKRRNRTTWLVTFAMILIILLMILGGLVYGPLVTIGTNKLHDLKLPLLNIPWPVVFWSFIGSFAAMIYRFNRQPIYEFGDVVKWTLTRLVQGVVLGSAFYLILVSGLSLLTDVAPPDSDSTSNKIATEMILILSFLVGFSDRFADSVFNTLIEQYSKRAENALSHETSKTESKN